MTTTSSNLSTSFQRESGPPAEESAEVRVSISNTPIKNTNSDLESSIKVSQLSSSSSSSLTSTASSTGLNNDEHRYLDQCSDSTCSCACSCCSCTDRHGTSDEDSSCGTTHKEMADQSSEFFLGNDNDYLYDDAHFPLIQSTDFSCQLPCAHSASENSGESSKNAKDNRVSPVVTAHQSVDKSLPNIDNHICIQCYAWPELQKLKGKERAKISEFASGPTDQPKNFYGECCHIPTNPLECAFGGSVNYLTLALTDADKNPSSIEKRQRIESALKAQFSLLIDQFEKNPEDTARKLYGISVIDVDDLDMATSWEVSELDRAKILTVTLVRRLRQCPDSFEDVCKVLKNIPAMQDACGTEITVL